MSLCMYKGDDRTYLNKTVQGAPVNVILLVCVSVIQNPKICKQIETISNCLIYLCNIFKQILNQIKQFVIPKSHRILMKIRPSDSAYHEPYCRGFKLPSAKF